ncbi:hypothetical protein CMV_005769 [Castanea mollissima]|uniref:Uncharacterized protein n=1 Tax=Castanea mollissima TaxID=60419 RepID=A0A8J4RXD7_9ROSI|nr:hypothetical protein CMV_005769 [Castanea mollissima]
MSSIIHTLQNLFPTETTREPQGSHKDFTPSDLYLKFYPSSTLHEIKTEDGFIISCRQWKCNHISQSLKDQNNHIQFSFLMDIGRFDVPAGSLNCLGST